MGKGGSSKGDSSKLYGYLPRTAVFVDADLTQAQDSEHEQAQKSEQVQEPGSEQAQVQTHDKTEGTDSPVLVNTVLSESEDETETSEDEKEEEDEDTIDGMKAKIENTKSKLKEMTEKLKVMQLNETKEKTKVDRDEILEVFVQKPTGGTLTLNVKPYDTIKSVKVQIQKKEGIAFNEQRLYFEDTQLENRKTIKGCNIQKGNTLRCALRGQGGAGKRPKSSMTVGDGIFVQPNADDIQLVTEALNAVNRDWTQDDWAALFLQEFYTVDVLNNVVVQVKGGTFEMKAAKILGTVPTFLQIEETIWEIR